MKPLIYIMKAIVSAVPKRTVLNIVSTCTGEKNIISNIIAKKRKGLEINQNTIDIPYHSAEAIPVKSQAPALEYCGGCEKR